MKSQRDIFWGLIMDTWREQEIKGKERKQENMQTKKVNLWIIGDMGSLFVENTIQEINLVEDGKSNGGLFFKFTDNFLTSTNFKMFHHTDFEYSKVVNFSYTYIMNQGRCCG